jgi:hypothetical protein
MLENRSFDHNLGELRLRELCRAGHCGKRNHKEGRKMKSLTTVIALMDSGLSSAQFRF